MNRIFTIVLLCACFFTAGGCKAPAGEKKVGMEPEEVVTAFTKAVAGGDFAGAMELCDSLAMNGYIEEMQKAWHMLEKKDSSAFAIAADMLKDAAVEVSEVVKEGDRRHMFYSVSFDGMTKEKVMILQKEEGEWRVTAISDRN